MPVALSYPGVYIEEVPSGVRTITGVATSIAAFVGRALRGESNTPRIINNFGDFERVFGGLWLKSQLGYAVRDFFLNGGSQAIVVRVYHAERGTGAVASTAELEVGGLLLEARSEGKWGAQLRASLDVDGTTDDAAAVLGVSKDDLFNLTLRDATSGATERYLNLTVVESPRRVDRVLESESSLARWSTDESSALDPESPPALAAASDPVTTAEAELAKARADLSAKVIAGAPAAEITAAKTAVTTKAAAVATEQKKLTDAVSDGGELSATDFLPASGESKKLGIYALARSDLFNLLCIPPSKANGDGTYDVDAAVLAAAAAYAEKRRALLLIDSPSNWDSKDDAKDGFTADDGDFPGIRSKNAALFFPRIKAPNPLREGRIEAFGAAGAIAGIFARTDASRGVWKAPAGLEANFVGVTGLAVNLTDAENGELNPLGINCLRAFPGMKVVWGARTLRGADQLADEWKYIPVRRTALFIEESLYRGTQWVVFEPNDEPLWAQIRLSVGAFMHSLFRQGAFQGQSPKDAYFVKCDKETTTQDDINKGIVNILVGFAPLKPAEFVVVRLQQMAGQIQA
jgi:uncharacterized protein